MSAHLLDQALMDQCDGGFDARDELQLVARGVERPRPDEQTSRVHPLARGELGHALHGLLAQAEHDPRRAGRVATIRRQTGAQCAKQVSAQLVHCDSLSAVRRSDHNFGEGVVGCARHYSL